MGVIQKGILGSISGKVGPAVFCTLKTQDVVRSLPKKSSKPPVQSQLDQRQKFASVTRFLAEINDIINLGYTANKATISSMNAAVKYHLENAIKGDSPNFALDYEKVVISNGKLLRAENTLAVQAAGPLLQVSWDPADDFDPAEKLARDSDKVMVLVYNAAKDRFLVLNGSAVRGDAAVDVQMPRSFIGDTLYSWMFFVTGDGRKTSPSEFLGMTSPTD